MTPEQANKSQLWSPPDLVKLLQAVRLDSNHPPSSENLCLLVQAYLYTCLHAQWSVTEIQLSMGEQLTNMKGIITLEYFTPQDSYQKYEWIGMCWKWMHSIKYKCWNINFQK